MMKAARAVGVLLAVVVLMLVAASPQAEAGLYPDSYSTSTAIVIPFYDITASHASFLILHRPDFRAPSPCPTSAKGCNASLHLTFYDQTCALKADQEVTLTPFDTAFLNVAKLNPAAPTQGAIFIQQDSGLGSGNYADIVNVDFTAGTATMLEGIVTQGRRPFHGSLDGSGVTVDWSLYDTDFTIVTFGPKEAAPFSTTITLSCPRSDLGTAMSSVLKDTPFSGFDHAFGVHPLTFTPATGTTTTVLDIFVFDTDEKFLGSIHNVTCQCFTRQALKTWVPQALTSDVVVYFHGASSTGAVRSIAGFQETDFVSGTTKLHVGTYLHHGPIFTVPTAPSGGL